MLCWPFIVNLVKTMAIKSITRISTEPATLSRWSATTSWTRTALPALLGNISAVDTRPNNVERKKEIVSQ